MCGAFKSATTAEISPLSHAMVSARQVGKHVPTGLDLILQISTALLITFAATIVLLHADVYFAQPLSLIEIPQRR